VPQCQQVGFTGAGDVVDAGRQWNLHPASSVQLRNDRFLAGPGSHELDPEASMAEQETHIRTDQVRAGTTPHIVRYVLAISLALAIVAMIIILGAK
jgi:hypothetical protein